MKKIILISLAAIGAIISFGLYEYFRGPINIKNVKPAFSISPNDLKEQLAEDIHAMKRFGNSVIVIEGQISSLDTANTTTILIDSAVRCELDKNCNLTMKEGRIRIKGILGGYDDLFGEALLVKCEIAENRTIRRIKPELK
jgi:hypothetical protein